MQPPLRYCGSLEDDLDLLSRDGVVARTEKSWGKKPTFEELPARFQAAVVARVDEKACWQLLKVCRRIRGVNMHSCINIH